MYLWLAVQLAAELLQLRWTIKVCFVMLREMRPAGLLRDWRQLMIAHGFYYLPIRSETFGDTPFVD